MIHGVLVAEYMTDQRTAVLVHPSGGRPTSYRRRLTFLPGPFRPPQQTMNSAAIARFSIVTYLIFLWTRAMTQCNIQHYSHPLTSTSELSLTLL